MFPFEGDFLNILPV